MLNNTEKIKGFLKLKLKQLNFYKKKKFFSSCKEKELTSYINKIFEQQEKDRIVRWLVDSIRESLELDTVLEKTVEEVGKLLKVDRCAIALFNNEKGCFYYRNEYRKNKDIPPLIKEKNMYEKLPDDWYDLIVNHFCPVVIDDYNKPALKSLVIKPFVHKNKVLGIILVHQVEYQRKWQETELEIMKDISSQVAIAIKQAMLYEEVQEATRLKSEFLSGMSHELRTPLNAIIGFSEMLLSDDYGQLSEKNKKFINNIKISGEHLLRLVNDLLDLSKIESGNMDVNYEKFNIYQTIRETVSVLNSIANKKNIDINIDIDNELFISADLRMFKQIMYNLLSNALKFTEDNGKVKVVACHVGEELRVEVQDTGIGIPLKDRDKIFMSFRQLDSSITRKQDGTGLGLTLTKKFIELHKGTIDFESDEGKGAKFWFTLPRVFSRNAV